MEKAPKKNIVLANETQTMYFTSFLHISAAWIQFLLDWVPFAFSVMYHCYLYIKPGTTVKKSLISYITFLQEVFSIAVTMCKLWYFKKSRRFFNTRCFLWEKKNACERKIMVTCLNIVSKIEYKAKNITRDVIPI